MADGPNIGFATLQVIPSMRGVQAQMAGQMAGPSAAVGKQAGGTMGKAMGSALKAGLGAAVAGLGAVAGLAQLGGSFDDAFDAIRVGTGATGDALEDLKDSFRTVFSSAPTDMASASQAVADLNTRLGLTGEPLEELSTQLLELSRITDTDLGSNIEAVTRVFGDWGVSAEEQAGHLDALFRASQATGITVDTLSQQMVKYGAPLRQLGFDFDTTAGLLGKFEKEGVNAELVMGSMRIALGKMAREGEPAEETLQRVTEQIANAGSASEANALALELFGARAGPDMAAAIREGRFDLGELYSTIANGEETILGAAEDTADFSEKWNVFKNQVLVGLEPLATGVFDAINVGMGWLSDWWSENGENVVGFFRGVSDAIGSITAAGLEAISNWWDTNGETVIAAFQGFVDFIKDPVLTTLDSFVEWFKNNEMAMETFRLAVGVGLVGAFTAYAVSVATAVAATAAVVWPFVAAAVVAGVLAAAMDWAYRSFDWFRDIVNWYVGAGITAWRWAIDAAGWIANMAVLIWNSVAGLREMRNLLSSMNPNNWTVIGGSGDFGLTPRANGGPVMAGRAYVVGEERPELFVPSQNGTILPHVPDFGDAGGSSSPLVGGDLVVQQLPGEDAGEATFRALRKLSMVAG